MTQPIPPSTPSRRSPKANAMEHRIIKSPQKIVTWLGVAGVFSRMRVNSLLSGV